MITVDEAVRDLTSKYSRYNVDSYYIRQTIENNIKRGFSTEKSTQITDNVLYKCYTLGRG
jgi:hypothetical protein